MKMQVVIGRGLEFYGSPEECAQFAAAWSGKNLVPKPDESWIAAQAPPCLEPAPTPAPQGDPGILVDALDKISRLRNNGTFGDTVGNSTGNTLAHDALRAYAESLPPPAPDAPDHARVRLLEEVARSARDWVSNDQINRLTGGTRAFSEMDEARNATKRALEDLAALEALNG